MDIQTDMDSKRPNDQGRYLSNSAEQSFEPGCGLKTVTLPLLYNLSLDKNVVLLTRQRCLLRWTTFAMCYPIVPKDQFIDLLKDLSIEKGATATREL